MRSLHPSELAVLHKHAPRTTTFPVFPKEVCVAAGQARKKGFRPETVCRLPSVHSDRPEAYALILSSWDGDTSVILWDTDSPSYSAAAEVEALRKFALYAKQKEREELTVTLAQSLNGWVTVPSLVLIFLGAIGLVWFSTITAIFLFSVGAIVLASAALLWGPRSIARCMLLESAWNKNPIRAGIESILLLIRHGPDEIVTT